MMRVSGIIGTNIVYATHPNYICVVPTLPRSFGTRLDPNIIVEIAEFSLISASAVQVVIVVSVPQ